MRIKKFKASAYKSDMKCDQIIIYNKAFNDTYEVLFLINCVFLIYWYILG